MKQQVLLKHPAGLFGLNSPIKALHVHMIKEIEIMWQGKETVGLQCIPTSFNVFKLPSVKKRYSLHCDLNIKVSVSR